VMNANGTSDRVLADDIDPFSLTWYPRLNALGVLAWRNTTYSTEGALTLSMKGKTALDESVESVQASVPADSKVHFDAPRWDYKGGRPVLNLDSWHYSTPVTFSPDGKFIAGIATFVKPTRDGFVLRNCVVSVKGSEPPNCEQSMQPCEAQPLVWSPKGDKVVFMAPLKENAFACNLNELFIAGADMKNAVQLTNIEGPIITDEGKSMVKPGMKLDHWHKSSHPQWSPDGKWIAFMSYGGIYRVRPDGSGLQLVIRDGYFPAWSPDSKMLMYVMKAGSPFAIPRSGDRIFVAYADGSSPTEVPLSNPGSLTYTFHDLNWAE